MSEIIPTEIIASEKQDSFAQAVGHYELMAAFVSQMMVKDVDYGIIPGTNSKPTLLKPGAEKLCRLFGLRAEFHLLSCVEDWSGQSHGLTQPLFFYKYRCTLYYPRINGQVVGDGTGSANSLEKQYAGKDKYGKDKWHFGLVNTIDKIAQKRSLIAAVLITCGASQFFTCDIEDLLPTSSESHEKQVLVHKVGELVKSLGWSTEQAQDYLSQNYGVRGRHQLTLNQLSQLLTQLTKIKNQQT